MWSFTNSTLAFHKISTPTSHYNHPDKYLLQNIIHLAQQAKAHIYVRKVRSHTGIIGNEQANILANLGTGFQIPPNSSSNVHRTPYWLSAHSKPIRNMNINELSNTRALKVLVLKYQYVSRLTCPHTIWKTVSISDSQITQTLKFKYAQYMGNHCKHLF